MLTKNNDLVKLGIIKPESVIKSQIFSDLGKICSRFSFRVFDKNSDTFLEYFVNFIRKEFSCVLSQSVQILNADEKLYSQIALDMKTFDEKHNLYFLVTEIHVRRNAKKNIEVYIEMIEKILVNNFDFIRKNAI